jgi:hypothetical protein
MNRGKACNLNGKASREVLLARGSGDFWTSIVRLVFLFLGGFLLGCHEAFLRLNDLFSQGSRQGTLMPGLLNLWYEQLS